MSWLWAVFTVIAAGGQALRNAAQKELTQTLGTVGAPTCASCSATFGLLIWFVGTGAPFPSSIRSCSDGPWWRRWPSRATALLRQPARALVRGDHGYADQPVGGAVQLGFLGDHVTPDWRWPS
jgi:hypothetical protein